MIPLVLPVGLFALGWVLSVPPQQNLTARRQRGRGGPLRTPEPDGGRGTAPPPAPAPGGGLKIVPQPNEGGRAILARFPADAGPEREAKILEAVRAGHFAPIHWAPITNSAGKNRIRFYVSTDVLKLGNEKDAVRVSATHATAQRIADLLGTTLPTSLIVDLIHHQAVAKVPPCLRSITSRTSAMLEQDECVSRRLREAAPTWTGAEGAASTLGKDWVLTNRLLEQPGKRKAANYGWFDAHAPNGVLWQPVGLAHNDEHVDYSQLLRLVRRDVEVNGQPMDIYEVLKDPELAWLLSKEGPLKVLRLPSVPRPEDAVQRPTGEPAPVALDPVVGLEKTSPAFRAKVVEVARRLGMDPNHLMLIMSFETRGTFSPSERNPYSGATGLIQFLPSTARALGTTLEKLAAMSAVEQLDWVERYLRPFAGRLKTLQDAYMAVLWPRAVGKAPDYVLWRKGTKEYTQNAALDAGGKGYVTAEDAVRKVRAMSKPKPAPAPPAAEGSSGQPSTTSDPSLSLAERAVRRSLAELARGAGESPRGSNAGPDVRMYFAGAVRDGKPLKLETGDWCAAAACWAAFVERRPGEMVPHEWRASGIEIEQDATKAGAWRPVEDVRAGRCRPARGDLAIWQRGQAGGWQRHIARVVEIDGAKFKTVGANEEHAWRLTPRDLADPNLLGFVDYAAPASAPVASVQGTRVLLVGDSLAAGLAAPLKKLVTADGATLATVGRVGTTIRQWARGGWLAEALAQAKPGLVLVSLGTNDMETPGDRSADIGAIVDRVRAAGAGLVWVEPPDMPTLRDRAQVRATLHATIPAERLFPGPSVPIQRAKDRIHATPQGYADLAAALWSWVKRGWEKRRA